MLQLLPMPQGPQALYVERHITNVFIMDSFRDFTRLMTNQAHVITNNMVFEVNVRVGPQLNARTPTSRICDLMTINTPTFHGTKVVEDPHGFIDEIFKVVDYMGVIPRERKQN